MSSHTTEAEAKAAVRKLGGLSWKQLSKRLWTKFNDDDVLNRAAILSYYFLLALFPLLLFLTALLGYFAEAGTELRRNLLTYLGRVVPISAFDLINATVDEISRNSGGGKLSFGLLTALWFASSGMGAIIEALNIAYGVRESRTWWKRTLLAVVLTIALAAFIITALALMLYGNRIAEGVASSYRFGEPFTTTWKIAQWFIVFIFVLLAFALIYYFAPDLREQKWYWMMPGAIVGVVLWLLISFLFSLYLGYFNTYSVTYGSLGAMIILMLWFYLTGAAIIVGGEVNSVIEHAAARAGTPHAKLPGEKAPDQGGKAQAAGASP